ncbi:MAG: DHHA1 domain-containing protein, partial [Gaiellaceae bacterium]
IRQQEKADGAIVASVTDGRVHIVVNVAESVGVDAAKLAAEMGQIVGGRGGGKPTMAQAGGNAPDAIPGAFAAAKKALA